ncbi:MAG: outer membrane beta-barrel protein [Bacteroidales bacterium]|nr:outer membrane beta-barrel protein [Bacteroidales bacterium]
MKRILSFLLIFVCTFASAQVYIDFNQMQQYQNVRLKLQLQDAASHEAIPYASVYLVPKGDTTITNFALTDEKGAVEIREIKPGKYMLNAEMIGYKPYEKEHDIRGWTVDLGIITMEEDPEFIDAATITAMGNPVTVKKDTLEFNANAFRVGENAMLGELLKRMPGIEVGEDGSVKVNGEAVDKLTVGGKTFFFKDPSMAVKNLPAKIVNKIKVIDKDKPQAQFTGVSNGKEDKEKVMDLELKEEYRKGWFGNAKLLGGMSLPPKDADPLMERRKFLFNGNALLSGYNDQDQVVFLGNGMNAPEPGAFLVFGWDRAGSDAFDGKNGLVTTGQLGANYNTNRIKGFATTASANYKHSFKDARERSSRTAFQDDGNNLLTDGTYNGTGSSDGINLDFEMESQEGADVSFNFYPYLNFSRKDRHINEGSATSAGGSELNQTEGVNIQNSRFMEGGGSFWTGIKKLGKERRSLTLGGNFGLSGQRGESQEYRKTTGGGAMLELRDLLYDIRSRELSFGGDLAYTEPFGEAWALQARVEGRFRRSESGKAATDRMTSLPNDYYSTSSHNRYIWLNERLLVQYRKDPFNLTGGLQVEQSNNETRSVSLGKESFAPGEWRVNLAPYVTFRYAKEALSFYAYLDGRSSTPSNRQLLATLDISDPMQITAGNAWLKPSFSQNGRTGFQYSNPKSGTFLDLHINGGLVTNGVVNATWFDTDGIRYAIPVNAKSPSANGGAYFNFNQPLDKGRHLTFYLSASIGLNRATSYQPGTRMDGLITGEGFDYQTMMANLWGDASGSRFYSGESGFKESLTRSLQWTLLPRLSYRGDHFSANTGYIATNNRTRYSLDNTADTDTWQHIIMADMMYQSSKGLEISTSGNYTFYRGYSYGFGAPKFIWNAGISQTIKAFTVSLKVSDILGQGNNLSRVATDEYIQDTYTNLLGRYFLVGVSFNFGKMNAKNNRAVQDAMWRNL